MDDGGDKQFISEDVTKILQDVFYPNQSILHLFGVKEEEKDNKNLNIPFIKEKATTYANQLIDMAIRNLVKLNKPFKYCVTAVLMQNSGAGINTCSNYDQQVCGYNDMQTDGLVIYKIELGDNIIVMGVFAHLI